MSKKLTTDEFIERSIKKHGYKYDYNISVYVNKRTKIKFICPKHGIVEQYPLTHINYSGCPLCFNRGKSNKITFIKKSNEIHNDKYDYSLVKYINAKSKVKIICPEHGIFEQRPNDHLSGYGCLLCSGKYLKKDEFIINGNKIHNYKYDYSLVNYKNNKTKVKIICPIHGIFEQRPDNHLHNGCPNCNKSNGEIEIKNILNKNNINFETQKTFDNLKYKQNLYFDFYLPDYKTCIEYDGKQHYESIDFFGGKKEFEKIQKRDKIKNEYCKNNNIHLLRIKYNDNILSKITSLLPSTPMSN